MLDGRVILQQLATSPALSFATLICISSLALLVGDRSIVRSQSCSGCVREVHVPAHPPPRGRLLLYTIALCSPPPLPSTGKMRKYQPASMREEPVVVRPSAMHTSIAYRTLQHTPQIRGQPQGLDRHQYAARRADVLNIDRCPSSFGPWRYTRRARCKIFPRFQSLLQTLV